MLFAVLCVCDEPLRELLLEQLVVLVVVVRQHIRRFLPDLLNILQEFWGRSNKIQHICMQVSPVTHINTVRCVSTAAPIHHEKSMAYCTMPM